jgi:tRNA (mo5U34)-methyltransferase
MTWGGALTTNEIKTKIDELGPWFYRFEFAPGIATAPKVPEAVEQIFETRLDMITPVIKNHFGPRLREIECLDIGCHEGFYSLAMARLGMKRVIGIDARLENLERARFVAEAMALSVEYRLSRVEDLPAKPYPLTLFLGVLYHVENPMLCLRKVADATGELCLIETQVIDDIEGTAEWGSREWTRPYQGVLALIDESGEFNAGNRETGVTPIATCPSPKALHFMLRQAGFRRTEIIAPPARAYEQHARGKRVVCAAWK